MKLFQNPLTAGLLAATLALPGIAMAGMLDASDSAAIKLAMQEKGYLVTEDVDGAGDPLLASKVSDTEFYVYFYGCDDGKDCHSIQFVAGYDIKDSMSLSKVNTWNTEKRYGRVYVDDEYDPFIEMDLLMAGDGIGEENFQEWLDLWRIVIEEFEDYIDW